MRRRLGVVALGLLATGACGVTDDARPRPIEPENVPFGLLAPTTVVTTTTVPQSSPTGAVSIYLADTDGRLVAARREVEAPATLRKAITALIGGPSREESGLHTAITSDTRLLGLRGPTDGLVTIDLSRRLLDVTGRQQILALAQVVYTATAFPGVERVLFEFEGSPREVPNGDGTLTSTPVGRLSYRGLASG